MTKWKITCVVTEEAYPKMLGALMKYADQGFSVDPINEPKPPEKEKAFFRDPSGRTIADTIVDALVEANGKYVPMAQLQQLVGKAGWRPQSVSPSLTKLKRDGLIEVDPSNPYQYRAVK